MTDPAVEEELAPIDAEGLRGILAGVLEVAGNAPDDVYDDPAILDLVAEALDMFGEKVKMAGRRRRLTS